VSLLFAVKLLVAGSVGPDCGATSLVYDDDAKTSKGSKDKAKHKTKGGQKGSSNGQWTQKMPSAGASTVGSTVVQSGEGASKQEIRSMKKVLDSVTMLR
jgi:hypothetical protein